MTTIIAKSTAEENPQLASDKPTGHLTNLNEPIDINSQFAASDAANWTAKTTPIFENLLKSAGYNSDLCYQYLQFYHTKIIPDLGPYPQRFLSAITHTGLPLEFSVNYQEHGGDPVVRIGFEPMNLHSGTKEDPYNQRAVEEFAKRLLSERSVKDYNSQLLDYFTSEHTINEEEKAILQQRDTPIGRILKSQLAFGLDLKGGNILVKGYSFPGLKCQVSGKGFSELLGDSIRCLQNIGIDCDQAFTKVDDFMIEIDGYNDLTFFSWDITDPQKSRFKLYGVADTVTWDMIERIWTLNQRAQRESDIKGLQYLRKLWDLLGIEEGAKNFSNDFDDDYTKAHKASPMCWNYEMKPGGTLPCTKFYFPVHGENDLQNVKALAEYFNILGWEKLSKSYLSTVQSLYPERDLSKTDRLISWISFAYTEKTGVYLSIYYHSSLDYQWLC